MSVYSCKSLFESFFSRGEGSFYLVEGWIISFRRESHCWVSQNVLKFFILTEIFRNSILASTTLKRWNFLDNLHFKGKIVAMFLSRSHFLSICNDMTVKQHINHGAIQKVCHLHNGIFHSINLCYTFSILLYHLLCVIH